MQQEQQQKETDSVSTLAGLCLLFSAAALVWFRRPGTPGRNFFGGFAAVGCIVVMPFFITLVDGPEAPYPMGLYAFGATCFWLVIHKIRRREIEKKLGRGWHSRDQGISVFPGSHERATGATEPFAALMIGAMCLGFSKGLGIYLMLCGPAMFFAANALIEIRRIKIEIMRDAMYEQEILMRDMRRNL